MFGMAQQEKGFPDDTTGVNASERVYHLIPLGQAFAWM